MLQQEKMTSDFVSLTNQWHEMMFINSSGMPINKTSFYVMDLWTIKIHLLSCYVVSNWLVIIYQKVFFFVIKNSSTLNNVTQHVRQRVSAEHIYIYIYGFVILCYITFPSAANTLVPPFVMFCAKNLHQRTTMIKEMFLDTFLDNISSRILGKMIILSWFNNWNLTWTPQNTERKFMLKKYFCQRRNKLIATTAYNSGQKLLLKTWDGFLFRVLCCIHKIILSILQIIFNLC